MGNNISTLNVVFVQEARFLHSAMFGTDPTPYVIDQYTRYMMNQSAGFDSRTLSIIQQKGLDVVAIEYALRLKSRKNTLTPRFEVISLLCEVQAGYFPVYYGAGKTGLSALFKLSWVGFVAAYRLVYGRYLIGRNDFE